MTRPTAEHPRGTNGSDTAPGGAAPPEAALYDSFYYAHYCGDHPYGRDPNWLAFFAGIAEQIVARIAPASALDAGCAMGMVVEALRDRGVEAFGVDVSEYAIQNVREDVRPFCRVGSILDPFPRRYDLVVCIEVLEHLTARDAERAVANFVEFTDDVLFSSTPKDFKETTHFNVQPPEWWAELFARHGFYRDVGFDASFITPWAARFRRLQGPVARVVGDYERRLWWLEQDNRAQRELGLDQRNRLAEREAEAAALRARVEELQSASARGAEEAAAPASHQDAPDPMGQRLAEAERERDAWRGRVESERAAREAAEYRLQLEALRRAVEAHVPAGATVLVVSGGDDEAVDLPGRVGWHFPRTPEGWHAGAHPADGAEAAAQLESLRAAGAAWIAFPATALWWLESYPQFRDHLERHYREAQRSAQCALFDLRRRRPAAPPDGQPAAARRPGPADEKTHVQVFVEQLGPRPHSSSYVRLLLPLRHPRVARELEVTDGDDGSVDVGADVVIVERSWDQDVQRARRLLARVRSAGAHLVFSIDDNLLDLRADWFTAKHREVVELLAREADGIIVSTEPLAGRMAGFNKRVIVVPNALDERLLEAADGAPASAPPGPAAAGGRITLGYMGTSTHDDDLGMIIPALRRVLRRHADRVEFQLVGAVARPSTLAALEGLPVTVLRAGDGTEYPQFVRWMSCTLRWDAAIAPLRDDDFNRCKSDIKFLDYGALGIPAVFSRVPAYERTVRHLDTGLLAENTVEAWEENLERLICDGELRRSLSAHARQYVFAHRTLRRRAHEWRDAILAIAAGSHATPKLVSDRSQGGPHTPSPLPSPGGRGRMSLGSRTPLEKPAPLPPLPPGEGRGEGVRDSTGRVDLESAHAPGSTALVVVPDDVNYFYAQAGRRLAEALRAIGVTADVRTLRAAPPDAAPDLCLMVNLYELAYGYGDEAAGYERLKGLARRARRSAAVAMDCAQTQWFATACELCERVGVKTLLDLGLHDQSAVAPPAARDLYRFAFNGLTAAERARVASWSGRNAGRPLPWVFVGHASAERARLVRRLLSEVEPAGFVYLPQLAPYREKGPHLNEAQLQSLLERSRFHVWCSHHPHFYLESERFRNAALAGCLPLKVVQRPPDGTGPLPFSRRVVLEGDMAMAMRSADFEREWDSFAAEFLALPSLEQTVAGLLAGRAAGAAATPAPSRPAPVARVAGAA